MNKERFNRQVFAFGEEGQRKIEASKVGIVGLGGIGSQVAQALAYLGTGSFILVDDDRVDITNLNRLVGALPVDAETKALKVVVAERQIHQINHEANVYAISQDLRSREALEALTGCPVIFGCIDHDGPRLVLMELAASYDIVLIDSATEIIPSATIISDMGGRVVFSRAGEYCLDCANQIDMEQAKWELSPTAVKETRKKHGYGLGENAPAPAVISLNGVIANLAVTEYLCMITGIREPNKHLTYHALRGHVNIRDVKRRESCFTCGYLKGRGEKANIFRYLLTENSETSKEHGHAK